MNTNSECLLLLEPGDHQLICKLTGEIDPDVVPTLEVALKNQLKNHPGETCINLREVTYFGAEAIKMLYRLHQSSVALGRRLTLSAKPVQRRLFEIVGLDSFFTFNRDEEIAAASIEQPTEAPAAPPLFPLRRIRQLFNTLIAS
jgi:anti-anti-sigma factor